MELHGCVCLLPGSLEGAALASASPQTCADLAQGFGPGAPEERDALITWLGQRRNKAPRIRAQIGERLPWPEVAAVLTGWIKGMAGWSSPVKSLRALRQG